MDTTATVCILLALGLLLVVVLGRGLYAPDSFEDWGKVAFYAYGTPSPCAPNEMEFINGNGEKYCKKM